MVASVPLEHHEGHLARQTPPVNNEGTEKQVYGEKVTVEIPTKGDYSERYNFGWDPTNPERNVWGTVSGQVAFFLNGTLLLGKGEGNGELSINISKQNAILGIIGNNIARESRLELILHHMEFKRRNKTKAETISPASPNSLLQFHANFDTLQNAINLQERIYRESKEEIPMLITTSSSIEEMTGGCCVCLLPGFPCHDGDQGTLGLSIDSTRTCESKCSHRNLRFIHLTANCAAYRETNRRGSFEWTTCLPEPPKVSPDADRRRIKIENIADNFSFQASRLFTSVDWEVAVQTDFDSSKYEAKFNNFANNPESFGSVGTHQRQRHYSLRKLSQHADKVTRWSLGMVAFSHDLVEASERVEYLFQLLKTLFVRRDFLNAAQVFLALQKLQDFESLWIAMPDSENRKKIMDKYYGFFGYNFRTFVGSIIQNPNADSWELNSAFDDTFNECLESLGKLYNSQNLQPAPTVHQNMPLLPVLPLLFNQAIQKKAKLAKWAKEAFYNSFRNFMESLSGTGFTYQNEGGFTFLDQVPVFKNQFTESEFDYAIKQMTKLVGQQEHKKLHFGRLRNFLAQFLA